MCKVSAAIKNLQITFSHLMQKAGQRGQSLIIFKLSSLQSHPSLFGLKARHRLIRKRLRNYGLDLFSGEKLSLVRNYSEIITQTKSVFGCGFIGFSQLE